ncbi:hypothetical protein BS78_05G019700 [Paspalum vaginatum]|nr:hypothetical protein BS78_05G019700 [Paspalum vaginatum]
MAASKGNMRKIVYLAAALFLVLSTPSGQAGNCHGGNRGKRVCPSPVPCYRPYSPDMCSEEKCPIICDVFNNKPDGAYCNKTVTPWTCCCPYKHNEVL